jgi:hypothetical protein
LDESGLHSDATEVKLRFFLECLHLVNRI